MKSLQQPRRKRSRPAKFTKFPANSWDHHSADLKSRSNNPHFSDEVKRIVSDQEPGNLDLRRVCPILTDKLLGDIVRCAEHSAKEQNRSIERIFLTQCDKVTPVGMRSLTHCIGSDAKFFEFSRASPSKEILKVLGTGMESLLELNLSYCATLTAEGIRDFIPCCNRIVERINFSHSAKLPDDAICWIAGTIGAQGHLTQCTKLVSLNLAYCESIRDRGLAAIGKGLKRLQFLNLEGLNAITDHGVQLAVTGCTKLQVLSLKKCSQVTDKSLFSVGQSCKKLRSLNLFGCRPITMDGIGHIVKGCRFLQALNVEGCEQLTEETLCLIATSCTSIQYLNVTGCKKITENGVKTLGMNLPFVEVAKDFFGIQPHTNALEFKFKVHQKTIHNSAALRLQSWYRGLLGRRMALHWRKVMVLDPAVRSIHYAYHSYKLRQAVNKRVAFGVFLCLQATKIQASYRGFKYRIERNRAEDAEYERIRLSKYATKLQSQFRAYLSRKQNLIVMKAIEFYRKQLEDKDRVAAANKLQRAYRMRFARSRMDELLKAARLREDERIDAAVMLQRLFRSRDARKRTNELRERLKAQVEWNRKLVDYTVKVQRMWRGHMARKYLKEAHREWKEKRRRQDEAASTINAAVRGYFDRKKAATRRERVKLEDLSAQRIQRAWKRYLLPSWKNIQYDNIVATMKIQIAKEEDEAEQKRLHILRQHKLAMQRDSASETESEDDWQQYDDGSTGELFWYSCSRNKRSNGRPNENASMKALLGLKIKVYWPMEEEWFTGVVVRYNASKRKHRIEYEDGDTEWMRMEEESDRIQLHTGFCWMMHSMYKPPRLAIKAALFVNVRVQIYQQEYFGWRLGKIKWFDSVEQRFLIEFDDLSVEYADLFHEENIVSVQDNRTMEWMSLSEYFFGRSISRPSTLVTDKGEFSRPNTVEAYLAVDQDNDGLWIESQDSQIEENIDEGDLGAHFQEEYNDDTYYEGYEGEIDEQYDDHYYDDQYYEYDEDYAEAAYEEPSEDEI